MESVLENDTLKTPFFDVHVEYGGKMVPFAGYSMPVQYDGMGVMQEHLYCRSEVGLFDVSHMGQVFISSDNADPAEMLEKITPGDFKNLKIGEIKYTVLLNENGGIIDDLMVTRFDDRKLFLVINAGCKVKDLEYITKQIGVDVKIEELKTRALLALQGQQAEAVLVKLIPDVSKLRFMQSATFKYNDHDLYISRSGYTGEDGFEISIANDIAADFAKTLLSAENVKWIGLGARDSLRLEAGMCLYGHDLNENTTPIEANLKWVVPKRRREEKGFLGADKIINQIENGTKTLRVGIQPEGRAPLREGVELFSIEGEKIGAITSGGFSPSLKKPIAMGYVNTEFSTIGSKINAKLRGKDIPCEVVSMSFVANKYKKG